MFNFSHSETSHDYGILCAHLSTFGYMLFVYLYMPNSVKLQAQTHLHSVLGGDEETFVSWVNELQQVVNGGVADVAWHIWNIDDDGGDGFDDCDCGVNGHVNLHLKVTIQLLFVHLCFSLKLSSHVG